LAARAHAQEMAALRNELETARRDAADLREQLKAEKERSQFEVLTLQRSLLLSDKDRKSDSPGKHEGENTPANVTTGAADAPADAPLASAPRGIGSAPWPSSATTGAASFGVFGAASPSPSVAAQAAGPVTPLASLFDARPPSSTSDMLDRQFGTGAAPPRSPFSLVPGGGTPARRGSSSASFFGLRSGS